MKKYIRANSAADALQSLLNENGNARIVSGGSDLMVELKEGKYSPETLVDVTFAQDMKEITVEGDELVIGAAVPLTDISKSSTVKKYFPSLCKAAGCVGSVQIRNVATLTGNVVSAQPAADAAMALAPLAPKFVVLSSSGTRILTVDEIYAGFGKSAVNPTKEVIKQIRIPLPSSDEAASFIRLELRKSLSLPMLNVAAMVNYSGAKVKWARITMGPVGVGPVRAKEAEDFLAGQALTKETAAKAGELSLKNASPRSNPLRGSKEYREQTLPILVRRALEDIAVQLGAIKEDV